MRGRAQETISPKPAIPPLFPGVEQVQEFLVLIWLVDAGFNPPISLPAPALNRPQEICRYAVISQMRQKDVNGLIFQSAWLRTVGARGRLLCSALLWMRPQGLQSKITAGSW